MPIRAPQLFQYPIRRPASREARFARWQTTLNPQHEFSRRQVFRERPSSRSSSVDDCWSHSSSDGDATASITNKVRKRTLAAHSRLRAWEQSMKRNSRNGTIAIQAGGTTNSWWPTATVNEFKWGADQSAATHPQLRIRKEMAGHHLRRVEIELLDVLKAVHTQTQEDGGAVQEHFSVIRLDRAQPEVVLRHAVASEGHEQHGHNSYFGDPSAVVTLMRLASERSGANASALLQSLRTLQGTDQLVARAISQLEELSA